MEKPHLLVFGPGYTATPVITKALQKGWQVSATYRSTESQQKLVAMGIHALPFDAPKDLEPKGPFHLLISIAPNEKGDPTLLTWQESLLSIPTINSISYLSSTNVYGDHGGAWVDETTPPSPSLDRGIRRVKAENSWMTFAERMQARCFVLRLAGIYGPHRNALASLKSGKARCIIKPGQVFSRIHRDDIAAALWAAMTGDHPGGVFNLADDKPAAPHLVIEEAATILGVTPPDHESWESAEMSAMARSFYSESKKVRNEKVKQALGITLQFPDYESGLKALYQKGAF